MSPQKFYVTTAIDYVNDRPGLHHGYEKTGAFTASADETSSS
jgi:methionyl-tRNA synthetase